MFVSRSKKQLLRSNQTSAFHPVRSHLVSAFWNSCLTTQGGDIRCVVFLIFFSAQWSFRCYAFTTTIDDFSSKNIAPRSLYWRHHLFTNSIYVRFWRGLLKKSYKNKATPANVTNLNHTCHFSLPQKWLSFSQNANNPQLLHAFWLFVQTCKHRFSRQSSVRANFAVKWLLSLC